MAQRLPAFASELAAAAAARSATPVATDFAPEAFAPFVPDDDFDVDEFEDDFDVDDEVDPGVDEEE